MEPSRLSIVVASAAVWTIWGSTYLAIRIAIETLPPLLMSSARFLVAGAVLYVVMRWRGAAAPSRPQWRSAAIVGVLLLAGGNGAVSWAEQWVPSGTVALTVAVVPAWMVVLDWVAGGPAPRPRVVGGLLLGFVGVAILMSPRNLLPGSVPLWPTLAVIGGSIAWATGSLYSRRADMPSTPLMSTAAQMLCGGGGLLVGGLLLGEGALVSGADVTLRSLLAWSYLVVFGSIVAFSAYIYLLRHTEPAKASTYAYVNPVIAVILGWLLGGESLDGRVMLAVAAIVPAVALIVTFGRKPVRPRVPVD